MKAKQVDDVLGGDEAWKNVDQTEGIAVNLLFLLKTYLIIYQ